MVKYLKPEDGQIEFIISSDQINVVKFTQKNAKSNWAQVTFINFFANTKMMNPTFFSSVSCHCISITPQIYTASSMVA